MSSPTDPYGLAGRILDGRYAVESAVAEGGFAVVYRASDTTLGGPVALKVLGISPDLEDTARRRVIDDFNREARLLVALDHPAIARVLDYGEFDAGGGAAAPWMALEWIDGDTLEQRLESSGTASFPTPSACLALLRPVFEALAFAHARGIAHRDVKPANIMLTDAPPGVRLLDFGIAKSMEREGSNPSGGTRTAAATIAFTLAYASPEQVCGTRTGPWTDVHALALVLTEMLTGRPPYAGDDFISLRAAAVSADRPTPGHLGRDVGAWEPVLARALAILPGDRHPDAGAFLEALAATRLGGHRALR